MKTSFLIFPHQLFCPKLVEGKKIDMFVMTEDPLFFGDKEYPCNFHRQKLVLHRSSMKSYLSGLQSKQDLPVLYFEYANNASELVNIFEELKRKQVQRIVCYKVVDFILEKRLRAFSKKFSIIIDWIETPGFINTKKENDTYRSGKKRWFMADFYQWQRKRLNILVNEEGKPTGGKWSFDEENRKKIPKQKIDSIPSLCFPAESGFVVEAKKYVSDTFPNALGNVDAFWYPMNHAEAKKWLDTFLQERFIYFGPYEDAIVEDQNWLYHSIITPILNIGLLTPRQVVKTVLDYADKNNVPLASVEGFIRQIIGWREFMRATYEDLGVTMRTTNHWKHTNTIPDSFYDGTTGIDPIDNSIRRLLKTGYCHHIERLMVLGGFMFLCEIDPDEIYKWFMEMSVDSYDWVMVPNVYAMSQNADGGLITTKPYFSGSNYICKMSHYKKDDWAAAWDGLYWRWILKQSDHLRKNPRWAMMVRMAEKMDTIKKENHLVQARQYLEKIR